MKGTAAAAAGVSTGDVADAGFSASIFVAAAAVGTSGGGLVVGTGGRDGCAFSAAVVAPVGDGTDSLASTFAASAAAAQSAAQSKAKKTHLTCDADGWSMEVDVERGETGDLQRFLVGGDTVMANEKSMFISFSYDGLSFALNTVNAGFTYEPAGVQNFIRKNLTGGKTKGAGTCRINELVKKF